MKLLAFDTSSSACSVAIYLDGQVYANHKIAPMQQTRLILPMIDELLNATTLKLQELDAIVYGCGPGSFTGIRIASSVAQGLGYGANRPLISISSLAASAQTAYLEQQITHSLIALDARMNQIYWAAYKINSHGLVDLIGQEQLCAPETVSAPDASAWHGIGDAWQKYGQQIPVQPTTIHPTLAPDARALLTLGLQKFEHKNLISPADAIPVYLR